MNTTAKTLEVADDGTITIPADFARAVRLSPHQIVTIEAREDALVIKPSRKERLERIGQILRTALVGVEWSAIEAGRSDRWFSDFSIVDEQQVLPVEFLD